LSLAHNMTLLSRAYYFQSACPNKNTIPTGHNSARTKSNFLRRKKTHSNLFSIVWGRWERVGDKQATTSLCCTFGFVLYESYIFLSSTFPLRAASSIISVTLFVPLLYCSPLMLFFSRRYKSSAISQILLLLRIKSLSESLFGKGVCLRSLRIYLSFGITSTFGSHLIENAS
jgi:hypothetical protein